MKINILFIPKWIILYIIFSRKNIHIFMSQSWGLLNIVYNILNSICIIQKPHVCIKKNSEPKHNLTLAGFNHSLWTIIDNVMIIWTTVTFKLKRKLNGCVHTYTEAWIVPDKKFFQNLFLASTTARHICVYKKGLVSGQFYILLLWVTERKRHHQLQMMITVAVTAPWSKKLLQYHFVG